MNIVCLNLRNVCLCRVRILLLISILFVSVGTYGLGFTPTDGGLVVNLKPGNQILLSTMIDDDNNPATPDVEYFVCHYKGYSGGRFKYKNSNYLRLIPQDAGATEPSAVSIWTIDTATTRTLTRQLGGIAYTMWSPSGIQGQKTSTIQMTSNFKTQGALVERKERSMTDDGSLADVVFVFPTNDASVTSFDPNKTLKAAGIKPDQDDEGRINGAKGHGFLGMPYREVYWMDIPKSNKPYSYTNASLVGFNTTTNSVNYAVDGDKKETASSGQALYAFADNKHKPTQRTLFRLYVLDDPYESSCPDSYYFAFNEQDYKKYRVNESWPQKSSDSTATKKKIYTIDHQICMSRKGDTKYYQTDWMNVPDLDSVYYYVGYKDKYCSKSAGDDFNSMFTKLGELPLQYMDGLSAPRGAYGRMIIDTTQTSKDNLDVYFRPAGVFLRTNTGRNVEMHPESGDTSWICNEMWLITAEHVALSIKATLYSGSEYSPTDEGFDIKGWSEMVPGTSIPVTDGRASIVGCYGWARVYTNKSTPNGGLEFVPADQTRSVKYDNNGHFGDTIATGYPLYGKTKVEVQAPRLLQGYDFKEWNTAADGKGTPYHPGDSINLNTVHNQTLYAIAEYKGGIEIAISFLHPTDGKRYFLTHPGTAAPRFARARYIEDWTNAWQGMANAENVDAHYLTTYRLIGLGEGCTQCVENDYVFDPRRETVKGAIDSVIFYEHFSPENEEYPGLYYQTPNTILANTTWAGLFKSSEGWPEPMHPCIDSTKLYSTHYLRGFDGDVASITKEERSNHDEPYIQYNTSDRSFNGVDLEAEGTDFMLSGVGVKDAHYVILPDTADKENPWIDEIVFDYHHGEQSEQEVWSKLIGKQLLLQMTIGDKIVYFHPNEAKTKTTATDLWLSHDYRIAQTFSYIRDSRVESLDIVAEEDKPHMSEVGDEFGRLITSGLNSPIDVLYQGNYIDIVDTLRITLRPMANSHIKEYYGRWKEGAPGLHVNPDGSRYRDILILTHTFHHGAIQEKWVLTPVYPTYTFSPLADAKKTVHFTLAKVRSRQLLDENGKVMAEEILSFNDYTSSLQLTVGGCSFTSGSPSAYFSVVEGETRDDYVTIKTTADNTSGLNHDTLVINGEVTIDEVVYPIEGRVPLMQIDLAESELVWSGILNDKRYFIMACDTGIIFRQFEEKGGTLYKKEDGATQLEKGSADARNSDTKYITPWKYAYVNQALQQLTLETEYGIDKYLVVAADVPRLDDSDPTAWTYDYVNVYTNDNSNFEEQVKLKYGVDKWLKLTEVAGKPRLTVTATKDDATVFSWTYLLHEYNLTNNGAYPNKPYLEFGYNSNTSASIQTRYKAFRIYSMLINNKLTYCGREDENDLADLLTGDWKTDTTITIIPDSRFAEGASGLSRTTDSELTTTVTPAGSSPLGAYATNIVDTLDVQISLKDKAPEYRFKGDWSSFKSIEDAHLKIPLIRKTYHTAPYDSLLCYVDDDAYNYTFPPVIIEGENDEFEFVLHTYHRHGTNTLDVENHVVSYTGTGDDHTKNMDFTNPNLSEIRLIDEYGNTPGWCEIIRKGKNTITVRCNENGVRAPRAANIYIAYTLDVDDKMRFVNFQLRVSQRSRYSYDGNQTLTHTGGASGDTLRGGVQQVHENKRILYYYNASGGEQSEDQRVELPVRERNFYGWWRWYREGKDEKENDVSDMDLPDSLWVTGFSPTNTGKWNYAFRTIGGKVLNPRKGEDGQPDSIYVTQGRYTVFHNKSIDYGARTDPPAKNPSVYPPIDKKVVTYAVDISNYYDNLPLSMKNINNVDTAVLDTLGTIMEPTLSLREVFELHPWTEMADTMQHYKYHKDAEYAGQKYMEDHVVRAPIGNRLLLKTEQRYNYDNLREQKHSESLLGYYMKDDNWYTGGWDDARKDSMIWCGGWDADCIWYIYNKKEDTYTRIDLKPTKDDDFLIVNAKTNITSASGVDTVIYCLRAKSVYTAQSGEPGDEDKPVVGDSVYNICRYTIIYHRKEKFGPQIETNGKAIITNEEIDEHFDVLERLNFDYNKPGKEYQLYPHPLQWSDASYGFTYPLNLNIIHNRLHAQEDFPNMGEYGLVNRIPYSEYWHKMEQHGGAENGYMIYCDGMASAGQVAALSLESHLCEGQKLYFSGYVGNCSNQTASNKARPNFLFSVQGSKDGSKWTDVTSYMTGDLEPSNKWYQIYFPIEMDKDYTNYRVRVFNMASNNDGNDFIIDDMRIFATKPPLMVYQANTTCKADNEADSLTHVVLRLDYQGFTEDAYIEGKISNEFYTIMDVSKTNDTTFLKLEDQYYNEDTIKAVPPHTKDTLYGKIPLPDRYYHPLHADSIFPNLQELVNKFERTLDAHVEDPSVVVFREGYIYEHLDDSIRPVLYIIHSAKMSGDHTYTVHMSNSKYTLMSSKCAMTRSLKVRNHIILTLNGEEKPDKEVTEMCNNTTYDVSLHVKGTLLLDSVAPIEVTGTCYNDWLLYGDTTKATSATTYGYAYEDIVKVIRDILRVDNEYGTNANQFAQSFADVSRTEMKKVQLDRNVTITGDVHPYTILSHLVNKGYLTLYKSSLSIITPVDSTVKYTIFPIPGTGSEVMKDMNIEVCPTPIQISLGSSIGGGLPLIIGGLKRPESELGTPITVLADETHANSELAIPIDSLMLDEYGNRKVALKQIDFLSTNDPEYLEGIHTLGLVTDRTWSTTGENPSYYTNGNDTLIVEPSPSTNYRMRPGYSYTFGIEMMTSSGASGWAGEDGCPVGVVPFTVSVVPDYLRWEPHDENDNRWNNPDNWIGINPDNTLIHETANFAPLSTTHVLIPPMTDGKPYPVIPEIIPFEDSIQMVGFQYNKCKSIRFLAGAALSQQQRLEYDSVIADLSAPNQKWALRTAPIEGLLSGDLYMANADLRNETPLWEVGSFDASGRNYNTGNATFWLSLYSREVKKIGYTREKDSTFTSAADWSKVTNAMKLPLKPAQGWAVYSRTKSGNPADVRLPKNDDVYYYFTTSGNVVWSRYESGLRAERAKSAGSADKVGKMAFYPGKAATSEDYTLTNETASTSFIFGNPTMGYIDILGFLADNSEKVKGEFRYIDADGIWQPKTKPAVVEEDVITSLSRYLPPMHAIELKLKDSEKATTSLMVTLNTNRIVTDASQREAVPDPAPAPRRLAMTNDQRPIAKGIMTVTAVNPASPRCTSRLLLGQGFNEAVLSGEDAVLTTVNIDNFSMTNAPATPFNIYALEGNSGLSIDLRDEIVNVPISFYNSELPFEPNSYLWFTGVNNIDGDLVLYDALLDIERPILDGICLEIETPETSHMMRYYIRRPGYVPTQDDENPVTTGFTPLREDDAAAVKFIRNGQVFILRDGHVYSIYGQQIR